MKRIFLWLQIRALEATAHGRQDVLGLVSDIHTRHRMKFEQMNTLAEITRLKAEYRKLVRGDGVKAWA